MKLLYTFLLLFGIVRVNAQNTPSFEGKQLVDVSVVSSWFFADKPAGWYRIGKISGGYRGNTTFELRENADHSTLRFEIGVNFNSKHGSSFTVTNHSYHSSSTFTKIRVLTKDTYDDTILEVFVNPHNNDGQKFYAYVINPLSDGEWTLQNWIEGSVPAGYYSTEFEVDQLMTVGNLNHSNIFSVNRNGNVGIGTVSPSAKLSVNGNIRAKEIKVETASWPDYVFTREYILPSLAETEKHIKEKGHLSGIPSAKEAEANGIDLGEMNAKLLQKIEELTLHLIDMKKENDMIKRLVLKKYKAVKPIKSN